MNGFLGSSGPADWLSAIVGVLALIAVWIEYARQKGLARQQLAQELSARLDTNEMVAFAVTVLDWGSAIVIVPEAWREAIGRAAVDWNIDDIRDAVQRNLTPTTAANPVRLLHRHAFVQLFNQLERIAEFEQTGALRIDDLRSFDWLAHELVAWRYAPVEERKDFFKGALDHWYPDSNLMPLLERICTRFPKKTAARPAAPASASRALDPV